GGTGPPACGGIATQPIGGIAVVVLDLQRHPGVRQRLETELQAGVAVAGMEQPGADRHRQQVLAADAEAQAAGFRGHGRAATAHWPLALPALLPLPLVFALVSAQRTQR